MSVTISVGSGKGGTGKSTVVTNLAILLAKAGKKVCVVDLDVGGADIHILFGLFEPAHTLTDYLLREVDDMRDILHTFDSFHGVQIIAGTGNTLQTANMTFQEKQRLFRGLATIEADVILVDVGAGASYHVLDFFMNSDIQICATLPEPTAIMDFYNFIQLATIRKALSSFLSHSQVSSSLKKNSFSSLGEVFQLAEEKQEGAKELAQQSLRFFHPLLITNRVGENTRLNKLKLQKMTSKYLGISVPDLGEIPNDPMVLESSKSFLPVCEYSPNAPASLALTEISNKLVKIIDLFVRKQQNH